MDAMRWMGSLPVSAERLPGWLLRRVPSHARRLKEEARRSLPSSVDLKPGRSHFEDRAAIPCPAAVPVTRLTLPSAKTALIDVPLRRLALSS